MDSPHARVYAALLLLYPLELRRQFGEEMLQVFADQMWDARQSRGWIGAVSVWRSVAAELLRTTAASHARAVGVSLVSGLSSLGILCTLFWLMTGR